MSNNTKPCKKQCTEEENKNKKDAKSFTPRDYQIEILEAAKDKNTIACLGTGTGKTFIAVMLIRELADEVRLPFEEKGKRIFFLVPTVPLVYQQKDTIADHTDLKVKGYSGDMNVDSWNKDKWTEEFKTSEVLVMTAEIFRIIVDHAFIPLRKIKLLIIDECHRAQGDHPYRQAMKCFTELSPSEMPRIFGLSASLINGKCKPTQLEKQLVELEKTLKCNIITASDIIDLQKYGADPDEFLVYYKPYCIETQLFSKIYRLREEMKEVQVSLGKKNEVLMEYELIFFDKPSRCLNSLEVTLKSLGPWCALKAAEIFNEELDSILLKGISGLFFEEYIEMLEILKTFLGYFIKECKRLTFDFNRENMYMWPHKLKRLFEIFLAIKSSKKFIKELYIDEIDINEDPKKYYQMLKLKYQESTNNSNIQLCSIIFVEQRITAYVLQQWVLEVKTTFPELDFLLPEFVVGHGSTGFKKTSMTEKKQKATLTKFRQKKCNILISTNVLEEGMDVQQCNVVIRFDLPIDFRAYVQSKGRARAKNSIYVLMTESGEKKCQIFNGYVQF